MYDDLARTQHPPPLEWFVVDAVIPSLALTLFMHTHSVYGCERYFPFSPKSSTGSDTMKSFSSVASITVHVGLGAAVLLGTAKAGRTDSARPHEVPIIFPSPPHTDQEPGLLIPGPVSIAAPDVRFIPVLSMQPQAGAAIHSPVPAFSATGTSVGTSQATGGSTVLSEEHAEVLTGPLPVYPELLRQAGVQGKVVLEAVVDTTGRVLPPSIFIVSATNPGFVAPARQALLATLFRPAMIGGKAVRMRVRIPYEFAIRNGPGRAW